MPLDCLPLSQNDTTTPSEAWILCNMLSNATDALIRNISDNTWHSNGNVNVDNLAICDWSYISCSDGKIEDIITAKLYVETFGINFINFSYIPQSLEYLELKGSTFYGTLDPLNLPASKMIKLSLWSNSVTILENDISLFKKFFKLEKLTLNRNTAISQSILNNLPPNLKILWATAMSGNPNWDKTIDFRDIIHNESLHNSLNKIDLRYNDQFESVVYDGMPNNTEVLIDESVPCDTSFYCGGHCQPGIRISRLGDECTSQFSCESQCGWCCNEEWSLAINDGATLTIAGIVVGIIQIISILSILLNIKKIFLFSHEYQQDKISKIKYYYRNGEFRSKSVIFYLISLLLCLTSAIIWLIAVFFTTYDGFLVLILFIVCFLTMLLPSFLIVSLDKNFSINKFDCEKHYCKLYRKVLIPIKYHTLYVENNNNNNNSIYDLQYKYKHDKTKYEYFKYYRCQLWIKYRAIFIIIFLLLTIVIFCISIMNAFLKYLETGNAVDLWSRVFSLTPLVTKICGILWIMILIYVSLSSKLIMFVFGSMSILTLLLILFYDPLFGIDSGTTFNSIFLVVDANIHNHFKWTSWDLYPQTLVGLWLLLSLLVIMFFGILIFSKNEYLHLQAFSLVLSFYASLFDYCTDLTIIFWWFQLNHTIYAWIQILIILLSNIAQTIFINYDRYDNKKYDKSQYTRFFQSMIAILGFARMYFGFGSWHEEKEKEKEEEEEDDDNNNINSNFSIFRQLKLLEILWESYPTIALGLYVSLIDEKFSRSVAISLAISLINITFTTVKMVKDIDQTKFNSHVANQFAIFSTSNSPNSPNSPNIPKDPPVHSHLNISELNLTVLYSKDSHEILHLPNLARQIPFKKSNDEIKMSEKEEGNYEYDRNYDNYNYDGIIWSKKNAMVSYHRDHKYYDKKNDNKRFIHESGLPYRPGFFAATKEKLNDIDKRAAINCFCMWIFMMTDAFIRMLPNIMFIVVINQNINQLYWRILFASLLFSILFGFEIIMFAKMTHNNNDNNNNKNYFENILSTRQSMCFIGGIISNSYFLLASIGLEYVPKIIDCKIFFKEQMYRIILSIIIFVMTMIIEWNVSDINNSWLLSFEIQITCLCVLIVHCPFFYYIKMLFS